METKETLKANNPYAHPAPIKCFKCNQPGYRSNDYPLRKVVHLAEREEEDDNEVCCEQDEDEEYDEEYEDDDNGQNYVVQKLILTPE